MLTNALLATFATLLVAFGCHHDTRPATPADRPPLPPASGTPIGFLIDDATDLRLTDPQLATLHQIDDDLAARLEVIDASPRAQTPPGETGGQRHMRGMGGGGMGYHGMGGRGRHARAAQGDGGGPQHNGDTARATDQHAAEVRDAFARVFAILDSGQRDAARKLLAAHDIDVSGVQAGTTTPTSGSAAQPADGSDEPTSDDAN